MGQVEATVRGQAPNSERRVGRCVTASRTSEHTLTSKQHKAMTLSQRMQQPSVAQQWASLPWKRFRRRLFKLQVRMWKAARRNDKATVLFLQRLIFRSYSARFIAIRQVSQLNAGKKTAGVDRKKNLSFKERFQLETQLRLNASTWKTSKLRAIPIPKKSGKTRMLKVPTIADRAWQYLAKSAIEPAHEAHFHERSYGFRPGHSTWDALKILFMNLRSYVKGFCKKIVEVDI